ncbi:hypothetical protein J1614_009541 [Plenodomus biglobosus]|nr:hypothetical protein J1614_009541 [Plenodomus biglobosus]
MAAPDIINARDIITEHIVYVARADIRLFHRTLPRDIGQPVVVFPTQSERNQARVSLQRLFETFEDAPIIPLFELSEDATRRGAELVQRGRTDDDRILEVNLVGNLYRELRQFVQEVEYTGPMPRIDGRAFLAFAKLHSRALTKEEKEAIERDKEKKEGKETERGRDEAKKGKQRRDRSRSGSVRGAGRIK